MLRQILFLLFFLLLTTLFQISTNSFQIIVNKGSFSPEFHYILPHFSIINFFLTIHFKLPLQMLFVPPNSIQSSISPLFALSTCFHYHNHFSLPPTLKSPPFDILITTFHYKNFKTLFNHISTRWCCYPQFSIQLPQIFITVCIYYSTSLL